MKKGTKYIYEITQSIWIYEGYVRVQGERAIRLFCLTGRQKGNIRLANIQGFKDEFKKATTKDLEEQFKKEQQAKILLPEVNVSQQN